MDNYYYLQGLNAHVMACTMELYGQNNDTALDQWLFVINEVLYYSYPAIMGLALVITLLSSIVSAKMVTDSHECYLTGFNISSFVLVLVSSFIHLSSYVPLQGHATFYSYISHALPFLLVVENWCFYTCSWLLLTAVAERVGHAMCGRWHASFGRVHGILASLLIIIVCFVCTLPQYWEFQTSVAYDIHDRHNCSRLVISPVNKVIEKTGGYVAEYHYYHWVLMAFSIGIPYLFLPIMLPPMCCIKMHTYSALNANGHISTYADDYSTKDFMIDEKNFNRLLTGLVMIYLLLSGPRNAVRLLHNPPLFMKFCDNQLMFDTLWILFDVIFYSMFSVLFFVNVCCCPKFRAALFSLCKCCCKRSVDH